MDASSSALPALRRLCRLGARAALDLLAAPVCPGCGEVVGSGGVLCPPCRAHLQRRAAAGCPRCGEPVLRPGDPCGADHRILAGLGFARAPFRYAGTGGALVRRVKFARDREAGLLLAAAMARSLQGALGGPFRKALVVPVPLHRRRRRQRGFDQAAWLAAEVAARCGLQPGFGVLCRRRATLPQGDPRVTNREQNVAAAFAVARPRQVRGRAVLLLDDVLTSGATARECARVLAAAGAGAIALVTACRA